MHAATIVLFIGATCMVILAGILIIAYALLAKIRIALESAEEYKYRA